LDLFYLAADMLCKLVVTGGVIGTNHQKVSI
jgi:hypothetical protein